MNRSVGISVEVDPSEVMDDLSFQDILDYVTDRFGTTEGEALKSILPSTPSLLAEYIEGKLTLTNARMVEEAVAVLRVP